MKRKKRVVILAAAVVLSLAAVVCAILCAVKLFLHPDSVNYTPKPYVDNTERNGVYGDLLGTDGKVYYRAYNKFLLSGIYEYSKEGLRRKYAAPPSIHPDVPVFRYAYRGELLGDLISKNGEYYVSELITGEPAFKLDCPKGEAPDNYFTTGGELYYYTVKKDDSQLENNYSEDYEYPVYDETQYEGLYRLTENGYKKAAPKNLIDDTSCYNIGFYKNYYYYSDADLITEEFESVEEKPGSLKGKSLYKYNLLSGKTEEKLSLDFLSGLVNEKSLVTIAQIMPVDDYIYFKLIRHDDKNKWYDMEKEDDAMLQDLEYINIPLIYRYSVKTGELDLIYESSEVYLVGADLGNINAYGDKFYFSVYSDHNGKKGLYAVKGGGQPEMIYRDIDCSDDIYILDESGVYLCRNGFALKYVSADGKTVKRLMDEF